MSAPYPKILNMPFSLSLFKFDYFMSGPDKYLCSRVGATNAATSSEKCLIKQFLDSKEEGGCVRF